METAAVHPVIPRPASTVVLLRPGQQSGIEVLLLQRPMSMKFMPGYWTFPGGAVEEADSAPSALSRLLGAAPAPATFGRLGYVMAAARELFEETGVLVSSTQSANPSANLLSQWRGKVLDDASLFAELLAAQNLEISSDRMCYLHRWVTPERSPIRFDTRFFVTVLPEGQTVDPLLSEVNDSCWQTPLEALAAAESGEKRLANPTKDSLTKLASLQHVGELFNCLSMAVEIAGDPIWNQPPVNKQR